MSVLTYIFPDDIKPLAVERLLPSVRKIVGDIAISELELKKRGPLDWGAIRFIHPLAPEYNMLFVAGPKYKPAINQIVKQYDDKKMLSVVRRSPAYIWTQFIYGQARLDEKRFDKAWYIYEELIAAIADISHGIIDSPECERIFTAATFRRYYRKFERQRAKRKRTK